MKSFQSLGIAPSILSALTACGYEAPTTIQEKAIPAALAGRDVLGSAQTGTGKTCAFGVPILQRLAEEPVPAGRPIRALILTPTRELAIQIDENLHEYGRELPLTEAVIFGGVGQNPQVEQLRRGVDILTATPGRLLDLAGQGLLDLSRIEIFVLDEADRMLDMGFIHDVRKVLKLLPEKKQTLFFSATLPNEIMDLVDSLLHDPVRAAAAPISSPVEVIRQEVCLVDRANKSTLLYEILQQEQVKNALVFTRTKHGADKVARELVRKGVAAAAIHGNKSQTARQDSLRRFKEGDLQVLVATDIAARGLDIEELSHVFNYNLPEVPETYIHRIGRTGRAGHEGTAISFCDYGELPLLKDIEKLLKKPIPRRAHDHPMQVFEATVKDAKGRPIDPEIAESRQAARERSAERRKLAAERAALQAAQKAAKEAARAERQAAEEAARARKAAQRAEEQALKARKAAKPKPERRPMPHGKQDLGSLQDYLDRPVDTQAQPVSLSHKDPLEGEVIMDATARLLAAKPVYRYYKPAPEHEKRSRRGRGGRSGGKDGKPSKPADQAKEPTKAAKAAAAKGVKSAAPKQERRAAPKKGAPVPPKKKGAPQERALGRSARGRNRIPPRPDVPKSHQKDSTEQSSLMKPFYIDHD